LEVLEQDWEKAMEDDLNTAGALGHVFGAVRLANRMLENKGWHNSAAGRDFGARILADLHRWGQVLGLFQEKPQVWLAKLKDIRVGRNGLDVARINDLLAARQQARQVKDFEQADAVRRSLLDMGVEVRDTPAGQVWDVV
jgi:cysteinyl-tRNA synthetase